jgi:hypothetical protein
VIIDVRIAASVRDRLGPAYDDLLSVMLDLAVPPIFLFADTRPRLIAARDRAVAAIEAWQQADPVTVAALVERVPEVLRTETSAQALLESAPWQEYFAVPPSTFGPPQADSPVLAAVPELTERLDDDGLIDVTGLDARPHGLFVGGYSLHYHQLLRRSFGSNIHYGLIATVLATAGRLPARARLAVDERRLRLESEHEELEERDYWHGQQLSESFLDDLNATGETVHGDPHGGQSLWSPYAAISVRWTSDPPLKTVQIEEYLPLKVGEEAPWVLARYLHAIRDTAAKAFVHCDGAVKAYDPSTYPLSQRDFRRREKSARYRKVFRLDGEFSVEAWSALTAQWFRGNQLVLEYLAGQG